MSEGVSHLGKLGFNGIAGRQVDIQGRTYDGTIAISVSQDNASITTIVARRIAAHLVKVADELEGKNTEN